MIYRQLPDGESQLFQYDTENQLVLAEIKKNTGESQTWEYAYDPFGRRLSKERTDKGALTATAPKQTHFVWDGSRLLQEYNYRGSYSYIYTDQDSYEPLAQIFDNAKDGKQYLSYFHTDQIGIPREMTDQLGNLLWYGEYTAWGRLKTDERVYQHAHQPFRLQNQYCDEETGLHYNLMRYYEPDCGRFVNQDPIGLMGGANLYWFAPNTQKWKDVLGLTKHPLLGDAIKRNGTPSRDVVNQGNEPTCGHNSARMLLRDRGEDIRVEDLIEYIGVTPKGISMAHVAKLLKHYGIHAVYVSRRNISDLRRYTKKGEPVIVRIQKGEDFSHAIVVDGITKRNGVEVVAIRDPHGKQYFSPVDTFKQSFSGDVVFIK